MPAAAEKFMAAAPAKTDALMWLSHAPCSPAPDWARALRETAAEIFSQSGLPTPALEGWQYTNLRGLKAEKFIFGMASCIFDANALPGPLLKDSYRLVLVNGQLQKNLSVFPAHVTVTDILQAQGIDEYIVDVGSLEKNPFRTLNAAHLRDGFVLQVARGTTVDKPVEVLFYTTDASASYPRCVYILGENAEMTIVEYHAGRGEYLSVPEADIVQKADSRLKYYRVVDEADGGNHIGGTSLTLLKNAHFEGFSGSFGGALVRQVIRMSLLERTIHSSIGGIYIKAGRQSQDFTILADHFEEGGISAQHFKGVIDDQARAVFQGKIHVRRSAQKTDGYQSHHALLLSQTADASAKPELEIYADDVKCSHGATSGQLDDAALFYLRSRGIPESQARALLIESFISEGIEKISNHDVRNIYEARIAKWLGSRE